MQGSIICHAIRGNIVGNKNLPTARDAAMDGGGRATQEAKAEGGSADFAGAKICPAVHGKNGEGARRIHPLAFIPDTATRRA